MYPRVIPPRPTPVPSLEFTGSNSVDLEPRIHFQKSKNANLEFAEIQDLGSNPSYIKDSSEENREKT